MLDTSNISSVGNDYGKEAKMNVHFSSKTEMWETPQKLFDELNRKYQFTLDVCAISENAKCEKYYTPEVDGLKQNWYGETIWMNPPYGREIYEWVKQAFYITAYDEKTTVVGLLPARTDTKWFHQFIYNKPNVTIEFISGRLKFGKAIFNAPFPSMIVVWNDNLKHLGK